MKIFDRKSADVLESAKSLTVEKFVEKYKHLTTETALSKAYTELRKDYMRNTVGGREELLGNKVKNNIPLIEEGEPMIAPSQQTNIEGAVVKVGGKAIGKIKPIAITTSKTKQDSVKLIGGTKSEMLVNVIKANPDISNKDLTELFTKNNMKLYGSEILNAKKKIR